MPSNSNINKFKYFKKNQIQITFIIYEIITGIKQLVRLYNIFKITLKLENKQGKVVAKDYYMH